MKFEMISWEKWCALKTMGLSLVSKGHAVIRGPNIKSCKEAILLPDFFVTLQTKPGKNKAAGVDPGGAEPQTPNSQPHCCFSFVIEQLFKVQLPSPEVVCPPPQPNPGPTPERIRNSLLVNKHQRLRQKTRQESSSSLNRLCVLLSSPLLLQLCMQCFVICQSEVIIHWGLTPMKCSMCFSCREGQCFFHGRCS